MSTRKVTVCTAGECNGECYACRLINCFGERDSLKAANKRLREALREISEGRGRFSLDNFEHARNTIEDMKELALAALAPATPTQEPQP